jgi:oligopeptide transport system ATP-binding protein
MTPTSVALRAESLVKHFPVRQGLLGGVRASVRAVDGVSFDLASGSTLAIVGESGCGKSTLARLLMRLIEPDQGRIELNGEDFRQLSAAALRRARARIQMIFQDPYGSLNPRMVVGDILEEPLLLHRSLASSQRREEVSRLLERVGLPSDAARRWPHEFSGGQRQRLAIARALAAGPQVLVCDEPVSALDVSIQAQILNLLADLQRSLSLSYVFISHDLAVVRQVAHQIGVMYLGQLVEAGPAQKVFEAPRHPYTQALLAAVPVPDPARRLNRPVLAGDVPSPIDPPPGCRFHTRCSHATDRCRNEQPPLADQSGDGVAVACWHWPDIVGSSQAHGVRPAPVSPALARLQAAFSMSSST